jgi:hypothetical protein
VEAARQTCCCLLLVVTGGGGRSVVTHRHLVVLDSSSKVVVSYLITETAITDVREHIFGKYPQLAVEHTSVQPHHAQRHVCSATPCSATLYWHGSSGKFPASTWLLRGPAWTPLMPSVAQGGRCCGKDNNWLLLHGLNSHLPWLTSGGFGTD